MQAVSLSSRPSDVYEPLEYAITPDGARRDPVDQMLNRVEPVSRYAVRLGFVRLRDHPVPPGGRGCVHDSHHPRRRFVPQHLDHSNAPFIEENHVIRGRQCV
jgi:hypothetical protein